MHRTSGCKKRPVGSIEDPAFGVVCTALFIFPSRNAVVERNTRRRRVSNGMHRLELLRHKQSYGLAIHFVKGFATLENHHARSRSVRPILCARNHAMMSGTRSHQARAMPVFLVGESYGPVEEASFCGVRHNARLGSIKH